MQNFIDIQGLHKRFGNFTALHGLTLKIHEGEFFTLLGPSGCGKTTSLRLLGGLEKPDNGEIVVSGKCLAAPARRIYISPEKRDMGMVFQSYALWPHMTVFENIAYPLQLRRIKKAIIRDKVAEALTLVGLAGLADRLIPALSGGQQQRVALARALIFSPRVLLLDEPLSNLDAQLRDEMRVELRGLQQRLGLTVLMVTHDQIEALSLSDRIGIMNKGQLEQIGTPEEVYHYPKTPFVRDFLGKMFVLQGAAALKADASIDIRLSGGDGLALSVRQSDFQVAPNADRREVMVAIRPEQVSVTRAQPSSQENILMATILSAQFLGDRYEYNLRVGAESRMLTLPANQVFNPGQQVFLQIPADKITLWPKPSNSVSASAA